MNSLIKLIDEGLAIGAFSLYRYNRRPDHGDVTVFAQCMRYADAWDYVQKHPNMMVRIGIDSDRGQPWEELDELVGNFVSCDGGVSFEFDLMFVRHLEEDWHYRCNEIGCDFITILSEGVTCPHHGTVPARETPSCYRLAFEAILRQAIRRTRWLNQRQEVKNELLALVGEEFDRLESLGLAQEAFEASDRGTTIRHTVRAPAFMSSFSKKLHEAVCQRSGCKRNAKKRMDDGFLVCDVHGKKVTK